jgi:NADP-dependent 3-hydroxy acid dehydrogenase YdfG
MPGMLEGKIVLVTGAARGIGRGRPCCLLARGLRLPLPTFLLKVSKKLPN